MNSHIDADVFAILVETGSFSKAAERLGLSKSAVSRRISSLEQRLTVRLLERTTRHLRLTEAGERYLVRVREALSLLKDAETAARLQNTEPAGRLKILAPMAFGRLHVAPHIPHLLKQYPQLIVDLALDDKRSNPMDMGADLAFQTGDLPSSSLICRKLADLTSIVCAAPSYLQSAAPILVPADLLDHNCILFSYSDNKDAWAFKSELGQQEFTVSGNYQVNNSEALCNAAVQGLGVARLPSFIAGPYTLSGALVQLLDRYKMPAKSLYAVHGARTLVPRKTRVVIDYFAALYAKKSPN